MRRPPRGLASLIPRRLAVTALSGVLGALLLGALAVAPASASASQSDVVNDCNSHGRLTQPYTVAQLSRALSTMGADVKEYTNCYDVIDGALLTQSGGARGTGAAASGAASSGSFLSTPLIVVLVALGLAGATLGAVAARRRAAGAPGAGGGAGDELSGGERDGRGEDEGGRR